MKLLLLIISLFVAQQASAQVPTTNMYLFDYTTSEDGSIYLKAPRIMTSNNIQGYNNQPYWFNSSELYATRQKANQDQTDIVIYDVDQKQMRSFTQTRQSEYSATQTPSGTDLSCIRVEDDGNQVLWLYPLNQSHGGKRILNHIDAIGYHAWLNETEVGLVIVDNPVRFVVANTKDTSISEVTTKAGRCFQKTKDGNILYIYKYTEDIWHIKSYDPFTKRSKFIAETPKSSEDFVLNESEDIIMGQDSKLLILNISKKTWSEIADLSSYDIHGITRLAFHNDKLVIVSH